MDAARVGSLVGRYRLESLLGSEGAGDTFLAFDTQLDRSVLLELPAAGRLDNEGRRRFGADALALSRLDHPNLGRILECGSHEGRDYLCIEFVPGTTLDALIAAGTARLEGATALGAQLVRGLAAAHAGGVVHGSLTPGRLRVTAGGVLKILGFGMAASAMGGPYTAPERLRGAPATASGDIFSAGAVLYEIACGRQAFPEREPARLVESILACRPTRPSALNPRIDPRLEHVIMRALARRPSRRFARAADVADALESPSLVSGR